MSSLATASIVFACIFGSSLLGLYLRAVLPEHHLSESSMGVVKLATGVIATMSALVLGLLISSAKGSFDRINNEIVENAARIVMLDRVLAEFGPETRELRDSIKRDYAIRVELLTSGDAARAAKLDTPEELSRTESIQAGVRQLSPRNDAQRALQSRALQLAVELASTRALMLLQKEGTIPIPMLVVLVSWLVIIFAAFGLFAPRNATIMATFFVCALSAAGAVFLILEMDQPLDGMISISGAPLRAALAHLGQ